MPWLTATERGRAEEKAVTHVYERHRGPSMLGRSPHHPDTTKSRTSCFTYFPFVLLQADLGLLHSKVVTCRNSPNPSETVKPRKMFSKWGFLAVFPWGNTIFRGLYMCSITHCSPPPSSSGGGCFKFNFVGGQSFQRCRVSKGFVSYWLVKNKETPPAPSERGSWQMPLLYFRNSSWRDVRNPLGLLVLLVK